MDRNQACDYIIAGAGSAGCALAAHLCEDPDITVCLIEAGDDGNSLFVRMPAGNGFIFGNPRFDWGYESVAQPELNDRTIYYPRGQGPRQPSTRQVSRVRFLCSAITFAGNKV